MACPTDERLLAQLARGHAAFEDPAPGFSVIRVTPAPSADMSLLSPPGTWLLGAVRNMGPASVELCWSPSVWKTWENCLKTTIAAWPAKPVPPLAGRCAMPVTHISYHCTNEPGASSHQPMFLHAQGTLEFLTVERHPEDNTNMYTNSTPGIVLLPDMWCEWLRGHWGVMMQAYRITVIRMKDRDLLRQAKWTVVNDKSPPVYHDQVCAHVKALREWGRRLMAHKITDVTPALRKEWNECFERFGGDWLMASNHDMTREDMKEYLRARAAANKWWIATDLKEAQENAAAAKLQKAFKHSLANPEFAVCRTRLSREFQDMP